MEGLVHLHLKEQKETLEKIAEAQGLSQSAIVRFLLMDASDVLWRPTFRRRLDDSRSRHMVEADDE